ncbi:MAG: hypothetical protein IPK80_13375 [Nannocystis sp.]|nr:hypothetical protein [Nannocystis sp.]
MTPAPASEREGPPEVEAEAAQGRPAAAAKRRARGEEKAAKAAPEKKKEDPEGAKDGPWVHTGMILEGKIGMLGCTRRICRSENYHNSGKPGLMLGGFLGKNFRGLVDFGVEGAWGRVRPDGYSGRNAVDLYALDPYKLAEVLVEQTGMPDLNPDFSSLTVGAVKSRAIHAGPTLRIHLIPRGRISAYVGIGLHYQQWRSDYETLGGPLRLGFHGISLPATAGVGAYVLRRLAVGAEFSYIHSFYMAAGVRHPELTTAAPIFLIESAALRAGANLRTDLPSFWSLGLSVRVRL